MQEETKNLQTEIASEGAEHTPVETPASDGTEDDSELSLEDCSEDVPSSEPVDTQQSDEIQSGEDGNTFEPEVNENTADSSTSVSAVGTAIRSGIVLTKAWIAILAVVVVALSGAMIGFGMLINERKNDPWRIESGLTDYGDFSPSNGASDQIVIPGYGDVLLEADTRDVMLVLPNPASNPCYFRFSILLKESHEVIYSSGLVPPGKAIEALTLKRDFPKGDYPAVIQIETFSLDRSRTPLNGANVEVVLNFR